MRKSVVLYSATGCPLCARYRALFDEEGHPFEERNTTEEPTYREAVSYTHLTLPTTPYV